MNEIIRAFFLWARLDSASDGKSGRGRPVPNRATSWHRSEIGFD
jgi:hypothetical protein